MNVGKPLLALIPLLLACSDEAPRGTWTYADDSPFWQQNANGYVGPYCCTGRTLRVHPADGGTALGFVHAYFWSTQAFFTGPDSSATRDLRLSLSAATDPADLSQHEAGWVRFIAGEHGPGSTQTLEVGSLRFSITLASVELHEGTRQVYYDMESPRFTVVVEPRDAIDVARGPWRFERTLGSFGATPLLLSPTCTMNLSSEEQPCSAGETVLRVGYADRSEDMRLLDDPLALRCEEGGAGALNERRTALLLCPDACGRVAREAERLSVECLP